MSYLARLGRNIVPTTIDLILTRARTALTNLPAGIPQALKSIYLPEAVRPDNSASATAAPSASAANNIKMASATSILDLSNIPMEGYLPGQARPPKAVGPTCTASRRAAALRGQGDGSTPAKNTWTNKIKEHGKWDQQIRPEMVIIPPALPMPVEVAPWSDLEPFFTHLMKDLSADELASSFADAPSVAEGEQVDEDIQPGDPSKDYVTGREPYYATPFLEFKRGVVYSDRRMDLCKMVVGPQIVQLMESLESNTYIEHFLLGNNIIGPEGAHAIAAFLKKRPDAMKTWYLAGNCIDTQSFAILVDAMVQSPVIQNVWLKRNPLGPDSHDSLFKLLSQLPRLRTLDLDQTNLGDECIGKVFQQLADHYSDFLPIAKPSPLQSLYLNGGGLLPPSEDRPDTGIKYISKFISQQTCRLNSLYLANNLIGDAGLLVLAEGITKNQSLERLSLQSVGGTTIGFTAIFNAVRFHPRLRMLDVGQSYATIDLGMQFNWMDDDIVPAAVEMILGNNTLRYLDLGYTDVSLVSLNQIHRAVLDNESLQYFNAKTLRVDEKGKEGRNVNLEAGRLKNLVKDVLHDNVKAEWPGMTYDKWFADHKRWLVNDKEDVRAIDSVYRNRDAGMARRGQMVLKKWWTEDNKEVLERASGKTCTLTTSARQRAVPV